MAVDGAKVRELTNEDVTVPTLSDALLPKGTKVRVRVARFVMSNDDDDTAALELLLTRYANGEILISSDKESLFQSIYMRVITYIEYELPKPKAEE